MNVLHKKSIIQKTIQVGSSAVLSRFLGIAREILLTKYLGASAVLDAFITANKIPNSLRKIFAEGALSASFIPTLVAMVRADDKKHINSFMTKSLLIIEGLLIALCALIFWRAENVMRFIVPGWFVGAQSVSYFGIPIPGAWLGLGEPLVQVAQAVIFLRVLISFIVFISSSALLASALQSVNHFFVPAISSVLLNLFFIAGILVGWFFGLSPLVLCFFILLGGIAQFIMHLVVYRRLHFGFSLQTDEQSTYYFNQVIKKFVPCLFSMSMMEISLFIDTSFASYLPAGSVTLIYLGNRFMGIALGVFAVAFSTILLPHFSRVSTYAPRRLSFYLLEATKLVFWVTIPVVIMMSYFSEKIFLTLFLSKKFSLAQVHDAGTILVAFLLGLFFFSLNKILLNIYYALHNTHTPAFISLAGTILNIVLNAVFINYLQATGLALATTLAAVAQTLLFIIFLRIHFNFKLYSGAFVSFMMRYVVQMSLVFAVFWMLYQTGLFLWNQAPESINHFFITGLGFWFWVGPLCGLAFLMLYMTRSMFKIPVYFLD